MKTSLLLQNAHPEKQIVRTASLLLTIFFAAASMTLPLFAQTPGSSPNAVSIPSDSPRTITTQPPAVATSPAAATGQPSAADMAKMMELGKPGENHKLLADLAGNWTYTIKMWMDPNAAPSESKGKATREAVMDGRYFVSKYTGKFQMPGPDGKMKDMNFRGMAIEGYDNVKKKFVSSWIDNMSTMIMNSEGTYDPATKTFTYNAECEMMPGKMTKIREVIKVVDNDHHTFEWYDDSHGAEAKTMEINYTRAKAK